MKKLITLLFIALTSLAFAQSIQVQNMNNYLKNKDYQKAKESADAAAVHESTKSSAKMWMYRGNVYRAIYSDTSKAIRNIDAEAEEKALEAYINALKNDKDNIYKDEILVNFYSSIGAIRRKVKAYSDNKEYEKALRAYDLLEQALPYDYGKNLKNQNITKETLMYEKFQMYKSGYPATKEKTAEYAGKLTEMKYDDSRIYTDMVRLTLADKDTASALSYIEKGRAIYGDNMSLIGTEIDIYMARKKTDLLKEKLAKAIEIAPTNEVLHVVLADVYRKTGKFEEAEKEYLKALEVKPNYELANYNLGVLYYSQAKEWNDKLNALSMKDPKTKEYETKSNDYFKKSVTYFESSYEVTKDPGTKKILRQITLRLGDTVKAEKYK